jgi:(2S)-methylsuccinyl-CoA dehydrogenase
MKHATAASPIDLAALAAAFEQLRAKTIAAARRLTRNGDALDEHQVVVERVAYAVTEIRVAQDVLNAFQSLGAGANVAIAQLLRSAWQRLDSVADELQLDFSDVPTSHHDWIRRTLSASNVAALGTEVIAAGGKQLWPLDETLNEVRSSVRAFAEREIAPHAEHIHRFDELVPERFITEMSALGYFGLAVPEQYGGTELGNLAMILTTEELSRASLAAAGSLITRPEILTKALLSGGTDGQKQYWLPRLANGQTMVAISVTEPDVGSDVSSVRCSATRATVGGTDGWMITGAKAWCTFAGRADVIALLVRTDPDATKGARGLTLMIVEKPRFTGHEFSTAQPDGGTLHGKADRTPGYRGMHSFSLTFDQWFVPDSHVVGEQAGLGRGFYLQMAGFAAGRLQTGGRACGLAQAALEKTSEYVASRRQFGAAIGDFQLTRFHVGTMAAKLLASRAITYAAALEMDRDERAAAPVAAQAKLFSCDVAVAITQLGQLLHGGWGYAEEYAISRYVADANVLPIFEGVAPVLALKVIGRWLLSPAA